MFYNVRNLDEKKSNWMISSCISDDRRPKLKLCQYMISRIASAVMANNISVCMGILQIDSKR